MPGTDKYNTDSTANHLRTAGMSRSGTGDFLFSNSNDNENIIEKINRQIPRLKFRDWSLGTDFNFNPTTNPAYNSIIIPSSDFNENQNPELKIEIDTANGQSDQHQQEVPITESMLTFFLGSALLFLAAMLLIVALVLSQRAYRHRRWMSNLKSKNDKISKKVALYPVQSIDIPEMDLALAHRVAIQHPRTTGYGQHSFDPFSF